MWKDSQLVAVDVAVECSAVAAKQMESRSNAQLAVELARLDEIANDVDRFALGAVMLVAVCLEARA